MAAAAKTNWSSAETMHLLNTLKELNIIERLDGRKIRNVDLFKTVCEKLKEAGASRTVEQIRNRWKTLKTAYFKAKIHNNRSGADPSNFPCFDKMEEIMGGRPLSNVSDSGVDVGFPDPCDEETSLDVNVSVSGKFCFTLSYNCLIY